MWALCVTEATASGAITTILNSFIHTLMYTYYVLAAFGIPCPFKRYITMAQIVQFLVGIVIIMPTYTFETCMTTNQKVATIGLQTYAVVLIYLFYIFYIRNYEGKNSMKIL